MFFLILVAHPKPAHPDYGRVDGAYVSCWVNEPTEALAETVARHAIEAARWNVDERDEAYEVGREDYVSKPESLALFDQALVDGCVLTFHTWPVGAPDDE